MRIDILEAAGTDQLCAGQTAGVEAAIHSIRDHFSKPEVEAVLLVDATNAFNSLNREFCDIKIIWSQEGTTQRDPLAMLFYALSTLPLIRKLPCSNSLQQAWYADDASASGTLNDIKKWWSALVKEGPNFWYFANPAKSWIVVKEDHKEEAARIFNGLNLNITSDGRPLLGAAIGCDSFVDNYVRDKVDTWCDELNNLATIAETQPHAAYAAYIFGFLHKLNFLSRTLPGIGPLPAAHRLHHQPRVHSHPH